MNLTHADVTEDPKVRLRHHSLMQDYQELHMDTEALRKKVTDVAREEGNTNGRSPRYIHLRQEDQQVMQPPGVKHVRRRSNGGKKSKTQIRVEVSPNAERSEGETKHVSLPDLNRSENETKTSLGKRVPLFDLNQISGEEEEETEEANNSEERMRVEESKRMSIIEMQEKIEMKLSSCRNGGNGSNKRKISWQDPVDSLCRV